jgi:hypothetical protein
LKNLHSAMEVTSVKSNLKVKIIMSENSIDHKLHA